MSKKKNQFSVENARVAFNTFSHYNVLREGFLHEGDGLIFVSVASILFDLKESVITTTLQDAKGKTYERTGDFMLYGNKDCFEFNEPLEHNFCMKTDELLRLADFKHLCDCEIVKESDLDNIVKSCYLVVWTFDNGEAKKTPVIINSVILDEKGYRLEDGALPEKFWESREDAYRFNEYKITDSDGEEFIEEGIYKRLMPTPEQWNIIHELNDVFKKAKEAKIMFFYDRDNSEQITFLNGKNIEEAGYDIESETNGDCIPIGKVPHAKVDAVIRDYCSCESDEVLVLRPTPRQEKEWKKAHPTD